MNWDHLNSEPVKRKQRIAVLASGSGSNAAALMERFLDHPMAEVVWVGCNRPPERAGIYQRTEKLGLQTIQFDRNAMESGWVTEQLIALQVDWIALTGFLMKIPADMVEAFHQRIINIHPSLLPKYGGKGMYGHLVHEAVKAQGDVVSGMTVHWVNEAYDAGDILFQATCEVTPEDDANAIAGKVLALEHRYYADVLESLVREKDISLS